MAVSAGESLGLQSDLGPSTLSPLHEPLLDSVAFPLIKVRGAQLLVRLLGSVANVHLR
jgi:hypothetical protein